MPSAEELDHDFLWRYQRRLPARGEIGIFNRSHYEEVAGRCASTPSTSTASTYPTSTRTGDDLEAPLPRDQRLGALPDRERRAHRQAVPQPLARRSSAPGFLRRIDLPDHNWKFSSADIAEREHWDNYQDAFSEILTHTSTEWAPWHVIPADRKWFARIGGAAVIVDALMQIDPEFPVVSEAKRDSLLDVKRRLEEQAPGGEPADPFEQERDDGKDAKGGAGSEARRRAR